MCLKGLNMINNKKLDAWAEKLLDTGKRNNLISFRDTKSSTAEIMIPEADNVFKNCAVGFVFDIFDPKLSDDSSSEKRERQLNREEYKSLFAEKIKNNKTLLIYAQTKNPLTAVKSIAKKAKAQQDETGINVAYLAFGFIRWNERDNAETGFLAPLLLVHVNIITGSILDPIKIEVSDDDAIVNPTFSYFLQETYGISLPEYSDGDTLSGYLERVKATVSSLKWDVISACKLGIFSFLKLNMYEDLKKNADLIAANENVRLMLGEKSNSDFGLSGGQDQEYKRLENPLIDLHTVVEADSSQMEAIEMAKGGKSFVLQGPPGTGKSQTITNIIAECLYDGKKVLFVSEKQAALNVVFDKLKKAKLADFCLELHSHKANKKTIIDELNRTLTSKKYDVSSNAEEEIRQKKMALKRLDTYVEALHQQRTPLNMSLYRLFELYAAFRTCPDIPFRIKDISEKGEEYLLQAIQLLDQYVAYLPSIGCDYRQNTWYGLTPKKLTYDEREELRENLTLLLRGYRELQSTSEEIEKKYECVGSNYVKTKRWQSILAFLATSGIVTPRMLSSEAIQQVITNASIMSEVSNTIQCARNELFGVFKPEIVDSLFGDDIHSKLMTEYSSLFSRAVNKDYKQIIEQLQSFLLNPGKIKYQNALYYSEQLMKYQMAIQVYRQHEEAIKGYFGDSYRGYDSDWNQVMLDLETVKSFLQDGQESFGTIMQMDGEVFKSNRQSYEEDQKKLKDRIEAVEASKTKIQQMFIPEVLDLEHDDYSKCTKKLEACLDEIDRLGNWFSFLELLSQIESLGLLQFINVTIDSQINSESIVGSFRKAFYKQWIESILYSDVELASFSRVAQDQMIQLFAKKDEIQYEISQAQIRSALSNSRPNWDLVAGGSAVSILRREGNKKRKQMPIRKLLSEIGGLVQVLKPCFLMSPLSVSTYLDAEKIHFDTVVFDEASQIFPQDALGAIYRGKQLIVVGDSKQMPPSNFFNASIDSDDEEDEEIGDINDFESILDICSSIYTTKRLAWHYRSHYESLIAFSNLNFYGNTLVTFPSSKMDRKGIGVDFYYVEGVFDRQSKTNRAEAELIVDLVYQNIQEYPNRSLGVVAFSVAQQNLIDTLLSDRRTKNPEYESFFGSDKLEPFFVKNLETVQGDERDTIIFSIAYAKDSQGRFIQNFGPLNREGGERRLNVAITRAKDNVQIVSSIRYTDINLSNTNAEGVRLLRAYLDYAENGEKALGRTVTVSEKDQFDSAFEMEVCDFLRDHGYTVDTQVGCSGYRIDLGLRRPDSSDYLLAIECDGATYHMSKNARDRDRLRQQILENMGWSFYRIWSTDWYRNNYEEKKRLIQRVEETLGHSKEEGNKTQKKTELAAQDEEKQHFEVESVRTETVFEEYYAVNISQLSEGLKNNFLGTIRQVLLKEAPLSEELLLKRIVWFFGREKVNSIVQNRYEYLMRGYQNLGIIRKNGFLYLSDMHDIRLRKPGYKRDIKYIAVEELEDGFLTLIVKNVSPTREGLYKLMNSILGFNRTGSTITEKYDEAIYALLRRKIVVLKNGILELGPQVSEEWKQYQLGKTTVPLTGERAKALDAHSNGPQEQTDGFSDLLLDKEAVEKAVKYAKQYIVHTPSSRKNLIETLRDNGFAAKVASHAADNSGIDWVSQAKRMANEWIDKDYTKEDIVECLTEEGFTRRIVTTVVNGLDWVGKVRQSINTFLEEEAYSRKRLIEELEGEEFEKKDILRAIDESNIDWVQQAKKKAEWLMEDTSYSKQELIDELIESEEFTKKEAIEVAEKVDWVLQAERRAKEYLSDAVYSRSGLIEEVETDGFSIEEATAAVDNCDVDWFTQAKKDAQKRMKYGGSSYETIIEFLIDEGYTREQSEYGARAVLENS